MVNYQKNICSSITRVDCPDKISFENRDGIHCLCIREIELLNYLKRSKGNISVTNSSELAL